MTEKDKEINDLRREVASLKKKLDEDVRRAYNKGFSDGYSSGRMYEVPQPED